MCKGPKAKALFSSIAQRPVWLKMNEAAANNSRRRGWRAAEVLGL